MEEKQTQLPVARQEFQTKQSCCSNKFKILGRVLGILVFAGSVFGAYKLGQKQAGTLVSLPPNCLEEETGVVDVARETYENKKFGFSISYPISLEVLPVEVDVRAQQRKYIHDCKTGVINGCGGSRWPEYEVDFNKADKRLFSVLIHVIPGGSGDLVNNGFTFYFSGSEGISPNLLEGIKKTIKFFEPEKPLKCLWFDEFIGVDITSSGIDKTLYQKALGYFYNEDKNICQPTSVYVWVDQGSTAQEAFNIPFQRGSDCISTCVK